MTWLDDAFKYHKVFKETSVLHYEYADEERGIIPNVELETDFLTNTLDEMTKWCNINTDGEWFWDHDDSISRRSIKIVIFYFEKRIDATTFRLIWG